jgi:hypothetical protein
VGDRRGGLPVQYVIQAPTIEKLKEVIPPFMDKASQNPAFIFTDINLKFTKPELEIEIKATNKVLPNEIKVDEEYYLPTFKLNQNKNQEEKEID